MVENFLLVVEERDDIRNMLTLLLEQVGFSMLAAADAQQSWALALEKKPELTFLKLTLASQISLDWSIWLKQDEGVAAVLILLLKSGSKDIEQKLGCEIGCEASITSSELLAHLRGMLRQRGKIEQAGFVLDSRQHRINLGDAELSVSPTEYRLLEFFLSHPDKAYSRSDLLHQVWGRRSSVKDRTVDVHIRRLRKILAKHGREALIQTVRGFGYRFSINT